MLSTKCVTKGGIMGVGDVGGDVVAVASQTVRGAVQGASEVGADVSLVARRAVDGVIEATREIGGNVEETAKVAVGGAIEAAGSIGVTAVRAAREILVGVVEGVKGVANSALPKTAQKMAGGPVENPKAPSPPHSGETHDGRFKTNEEYRHETLGETPEEPLTKTRTRRGE
jgi:hypothetical protein